MEHKTNPQIKDIEVKLITSKIAKEYILKYHYMHTFPKADICFGVIYKSRLMGVVSFGRSTQTKQKVAKYLPGIEPGEFLELQRMNISDMLGNNTESFVFGRMYYLLKKHTNIKVLVTHAGGCKNDCGIVYQSANWLYFGKSICNDFYHTERGEYKNIIAPMRYGRVPKEVRDQGGEAVGKFLFGAGELVHSFRYLYLYPLDKKLRPTLEAQAEPYPKDSVRFRKNQEWQDE